MNPVDQKPYVLVVDDENGPRQALRMLLKEDYEVLLASEVDEALETLKEHRIGVVITDIRMPRQSGIDLLQQVKVDHPEIQVIILTGYAHLGTAMEAVEHGAYAYLEKPFDSEKMLRYVEKALHKHREEQELRAQEYLAMEANRFETLGRLVSGMMHDMGTPLSVIGNNIELIISNPGRQDIEDRLKTMHSQIQHCNEMVRSAMAFLRSDVRCVDYFNINHVVETCLEVAKPLTRAQGVSVTTELSNTLGQCSGEVVMVRQALLNLITNACQAMTDQKEERRICIRTRQEGDHALLTVEDTGPGIAAEDREHVFDTLYTTKGEGTGLGLAVVRNTMDRHDGEVRCEDGEDGRGARFVLRFPSMTTEQHLRLLKGE